MSELKYPHEWFEVLKNEIPQPFRFEIDDNLDKNYYNEPVLKSQMFECIFDWKKTNQGRNYWFLVQLAFRGGTLQQRANKVNEERWNNLKVGDTLYSIDGLELTVTVKEISDTMTLLYDDFQIISFSNCWFNEWTPVKPKKNTRSGIIESPNLEKSSPVKWKYRNFDKDIISIYAKDGHHFAVLPNGSTIPSTLKTVVTDEPGCAIVDITLWCNLCESYEDAMKRYNE